MQKPTTSTTTSTTTSETTSGTADTTSETSPVAEGGALPYLAMRERVWSIQIIPWSVLPPGNPARHALADLAMIGRDTYALGADDGYLIHEGGRWYTPAQWMEHYATHADAYAALLARATSETTSGTADTTSTQA